MCLFRLKGSKGFTLTEILVVSVIIAILSAVAVPVYTNYIKEQRVDAVKNLALAAAISANVIYRRTNLIPDCPADCTTVLNLFLPEQGRYTVKIPAGTRNVVVIDKQHVEATYTASF